MRQFVGTIPARIERLKRDKRGYPVPFFVHWEDGVPLFPVADPVKMKRAMTAELCWICGERLGAYKAFVVGPMCCVNRLSAEPPCHFECAEFAVRNCPFMVYPKVKRSLDPEDRRYEAPGGVMIERNPGVSAIWVCRAFRVEKHDGKPLWRFGMAHKVSFWASSRKATFAEVEAATRSGLPGLVKVAGLDGPAALKELKRQIGAFENLLAEVEWPDGLPDVDLSSFEEHVS